MMELWLKECLQNENILSQCEVSLLGTSEKGQGYLSDIFFVRATGLNEKNEKTELDLVIKRCKKNETWQKSVTVKESFQREIYIYDDVFPAFKKFLSDKRAEFGLDFIPNCYKTIRQDNTEAIILENLKSKCFQLHSRTEPLNLEHIKLVLLNMARFHSIAFAFRDQMKQEFEKLTRNFSSLLSVTVKEESMQSLFKDEMFFAIDFLNKIDESDLAAQLQTKISDDPNALLQKVFDEDIEQSVIIHGDAWVNNFMFRYENENYTVPAAVVFLDWQLSSLHSPILDVCMFLYAVSSKEALVTKFGELLGFYHSNLSSCLRTLGSDPQKIFPYSSMMEHYRKYSLAMMIFIVGFLKTIVSEADEISSAQNFTCGLGDVFANVKLANMDFYKSRLVAIVQNFFSVDFK